MSDMEDIDFTEISTRFEAKKLGMRHNLRDGHILQLSINPHDTPEDILRDPINQQYMVVLVRMNDQSEPVAAPEKEEGIRAVKLAGTLCSDPNFQMWMARSGYSTAPNQEAAEIGIRRYLNVQSRTELHTNKQARWRLGNLRNEFANSFRRPG